MSYFCAPNPSWTFDACQKSYLIHSCAQFSDDLKLLKNDVGEFDASNAANIHEVLWQCQSLFNDVKGKVNSVKETFAK